MSSTSIVNSINAILHRQPEAHVEALDKQAEVAPHVQDDFDIPEEDMKSIDPRDQDENQASVLSYLQR